MTDQTTPRLDLPLIQPAQAQKHVTHNEALDALDAAVQLVIEATAGTAPPADPPPGAVWGVGAQATGAWSGRDGTLAVAAPGGGWRFLVPAEGWRAWDRSAGAATVHDGSGWVAETSGAGTSPQQLGINATADAVNRLAVAAEATLLTHEGAGHQLKLNKAASGETAALLLQTGFSGRAEIGTAGTDDLSIKVSADGAAWSEALRVAAATGVPDLAAGTTIGGAEALNRGHLLGPVAMAGGQPAGAAIERGETPDGSYVRLADGTQFCWHRLEIVYGSGALLNSGWTFPAAFLTVPVVQATLDQSTFGAKVTGPHVSACSPLVVASISPAGATPRLYRIEGRTDFNSGDACDVHLFAAGRWA